MAPGELADVQFVSPSRGWVVGQHQILATSDGGHTWTVKDRGNLNLVSADFVSDQVGWAVGINSLLTTSDGGAHWTALPEPCPVIRSVHFISPTVGYAVAGGKLPYVYESMAPGTGGVVLVTTDGGHTWRHLPTPASAQSICFSGSGAGWLGAGGHLYLSTDGGKNWKLQAKGMSEPSGTSNPGIMTVQCANGAAWGVNIGFGAASSQQPHWGMHADLNSATAIFAEQYFQLQGHAPTVGSPGPYAGPLSAISASTAAFIDWCGPCGEGTAPWALATNGGKTLQREGNVGGITHAYGASFLTQDMGWVVGAEMRGNKAVQRIVSTVNGGKSWQIQYSSS